MDKGREKKHYDLEERTFTFALETIHFIEKVQKTLTNIEICRQLVRSAGSVGANYIEANEALSKKDFIMRVKICRKEAKESIYWLRLVKCDTLLETSRQKLIQEATELMKVFGAIIGKVSPCS